MSKSAAAHTHAERKAPAPTSSQPVVQRKCDACAREDDERRVQRRAAGQGGSALGTEQVESLLASSSGEPLQPATREFFEQRLHHDFSGVRVHAGERAASSARSIGALAYTVGHDIVFGRGEYAPQSRAGQQLLAHELVHVVQQSSPLTAAGAGPAAKLSIGPVHDPLEEQAERVANDVIGPRPDLAASPLGASPLRIQRACGNAAIGTPAGCTPGAHAFLNGYPTYEFQENCDELRPGEEARMLSDVAALGASARIEIHGYASTPGDAAFNQNLSCARALATRTLLTTAPPAGAGLLPAQIAGVISHGPSGPGAARRSVVLAPPTPAPLPAAVPAAGPGDFEIRRVGTSSQSRLFFAHNSAALEPGAVTQIQALKTSAPSSVRLLGFASADEPDALAQSRADAVRAALIAAPDAVTVTAATGNAAFTATRANFTDARSVEVVIGAAAPTTLDCSATDAAGHLVNPPKQACATMDPDTVTAFHDALAVANDAMSRATAAVAGTPNAVDTPLIDRFFGNHSASTLAHLRTNLGRLKTHVAALPASTSCGGQCDLGGCEKQGVIAYNSDVDAASTMTLCVPTFKDMNVNDRARNLMHESAHGTTPLGGTPSTGTRDVAYRHERMLFQLSAADRLRNSDSYALFALFLREVQSTSDPAAVPAGISTPAADTLTGFSGPEEVVVRRAFAQLEKRLTWATDWSNQLFGQMQQVRSGVFPWGASWANNLMRQAARRFPLTAPPAAPTLDDTNRMASIGERYARMLKGVKRDLTIHRVATGSAAWTGGVSLIPGATVEIGADFFRASPNDQIGLLFEQVAGATLDVEPAFIPAYRTFAEWIHRENP